jgi:hypothetical protein
MLIDIFEENEENEDKYISFLVFEPNSLRIPENDILLIGDQVTELFQSIMESTDFNSSMTDKILLNKLQRIEMMIDLLKSTNGLIMTKFLNKIWRRYAFFSNLGEHFILQEELKRFNPKFPFTEPLILNRVIEEVETEAEVEVEVEKKDETPLKP